MRELPFLHLVFTFPSGPGFDINKDYGVKIPKNHLLREFNMGRNGNTERNEITLLARSNSSEPFKVTFRKDGERLFITCTCPEGLHGEFCEHKFRLASNDIMMLQHPGQNSEMLNAHLWVINAPVSDTLLQLLQILGENNPDEATVERLKGEIGKTMREGTVSGT